MGDLVITMPHALVAQANCQNKLPEQERGPELNVRFDGRGAPATVATFSNPTRDCTYQIKTPELVLAPRHPRDHTITEAAARARPRHQPRPHRQCLVNIGRLPGNSGNAFKRGWVAAESMTIAHDRENVLTGAQQTKRFGARRRKNGNPGTIRYVAA